VSLYSVGNHGYAQIGWNDPGERRQTRLVHRVAWEGRNGLIPDGMTVDHLCHNRLCIRIEHLRLLSNVDNGRRNAPGRDFPINWLCKNGHPASAQRQIKRANGRLGWTCGTCVADARARWVAADPQRYKDMHARYNKKRRSK
jgi:hypothetical protein